MKSSHPMKSGYQPTIYPDSYCESYNTETGPSSIPVEYWLTPLGPDAFVAWKMPNLTKEASPPMPTKREQVRALRQIELIHEFYDQMDKTRGTVNSHPKTRKLCHFCQAVDVAQSGDICPSCVDKLAQDGFEIVGTGTAEDGTRQVNLRRRKEKVEERGLLGRFTVAKFALVVSVPLLTLAIGIWLIIRR